MIAQVEMSEEPEIGMRREGGGIGPVILGALVDVRERTLALEARGFGARPGRTAYRVVEDPPQLGQVAGVVAQEFWARAELLDRLQAHIEAGRVRFQTGQVLSVSGGLTMVG